MRKVVGKNDLFQALNIYVLKYGTAPQHLESRNALMGIPSVLFEGRLQDRKKSWC